MIKILEETSLTKLEVKANALIEKGWKVQGELTSTVVDFGITIYALIMTNY